MVGANGDGRGETMAVRRESGELKVYVYGSQQTLIRSRRGLQGREGSR